MSEAIPKVSVIVPAYNTRPFIRDTLASVQSQTLQQFEVLVVDDGSTDGTDEVVREFVERDPRFKLLSKQNGGPSSARNLGLSLARAEYVALLDADDLYRPEKLANHVAVLDADPGVGVVYSASRIIREDGRPTFYSMSGKPIHPDPLLSMLCKNFIGNGSNAVFRRRLVEEAGGFDEQLRCSEDTDFWLRIAALERWHFRRVPQVLVDYRLRFGGGSHNLERMRRDREQVIEAAHARSPDRIAPLLPAAYAYLYRFLARQALTAGNVVAARAFIDLAIGKDASIFRRDPRSLFTLIAARLIPQSLLTAYIRS